ncbi:MAG: DUF4071 domain-containing protein, partial [Rhodobacteraceae bacterium]|nr:DUF4071 domain-containing protein [Paracoccaceae bacterium]
QTVRDHDDIIALGARLLKDRAFASDGASRRQFARRSAARYLEAFDVSKSSYAGINAATMTLIAGDVDEARSFVAERLRVSAGGASMLSAEDSYYRRATQAEAHLLLGEIPTASALLADAIQTDPSNFVIHAGTLRQFEMICAALGTDTSWLDRHRPPPAIFFGGHMFSSDGDKRLQEMLQSEISAAFDRIRPGFAFGALAAGTDILMAELLLARGTELHVVLPMREDDFVDASVKPFGAAWLSRYQECRAACRSLRLATFEKHMGEDDTFAFGADFAMGLAIRQANILRTKAVHVAAWDGASSGGVAGTGIDVERWRTTNLAQTIIPFPEGLRYRPNRSVSSSQERPRTLKAMLFADVAGFSKLDERHVQAFTEKVMTPLADAVHRLPNQPLMVATWGDGIHMVFDHVEDGASAAIALLSRMAAIDLVNAGLPNHLALRIGAHYGPVTDTRDPFTGLTNYSGTHTVIAARIEPVALPGTAYVSEPFAAILALRAPSRFETDYVGRTDLPKKFGSMRLFSLRARQTV